MVSVSPINKTIVTTYDETSRMQDFCLDENGGISKDFFDWFLNEETYFAKTGMLIIDNLINESDRFAMSFDFSNPDCAEFVHYVYADQSPICRFLFKRQDHVTMSDIAIEIKYFSLSNAMKLKDVIIPETLSKDTEDATIEILNSYNKPGRKHLSNTEILKKVQVLTRKRINDFNCIRSVYSIYALMYYMSKRDPEEITTFFNEQLDRDLGSENTVKAIYKYTGYIDLRRNKVFRPIIKKDPNDPVRDYKRHIQKWTVRGHYRKTKNGLIWVQPHEKGSGELEKRVYGTRDEKDLIIIPKIFEVERRIKTRVSNPEIKKGVVDSKESTPPSTLPSTPPPVQPKRKSVISKIIDAFLFWK